MLQATAKFTLPLIDASQASQDVTHNQAILMLESMSSLAVASITPTVATPGSPANGDAYLVDASPTGTWADDTAGGKIAFYFQRWYYVTPIEGLLTYAKDDDSLYSYDGAAWNTAGGGGGTSFLVGMIMPYAGTSAPAGWVLCDGASLLRAGTYATLFGVVSTTFGSADGTHFNVPDLRGRTVIGVGTGGGLTARALGDNTGGEEIHQLTTAELASHQHSISLDSLPGGAGSGPGDAAGPGSSSTGTEGSDTPHNNMPPFLALTYIIKY